MVILVKELEDMQNAKLHRYNYYCYENGYSPQEALKRMPEEKKREIANYKMENGVFHISGGNISVDGRDYKFRPFTFPPMESDHTIKFYYHAVKKINGPVTCPTFISEYNPDHNQELELYVDRADFTESPDVRLSEKCQIRESIISPDGELIPAEKLYERESPQEELDAASGLDNAEEMDELEEEEEEEYS